MRIYMDNCCLNRPFDDQSQLRIKLESEAKLHVQDEILRGEIEMAWSDILDCENEANPFSERKRAINKWKKRAIIDVKQTPDILKHAKNLLTCGIKPKDALHLACAVSAQCDFFLTTDDILIKKMNSRSEINVLNPVTFIYGED
jgi:predicted nucleic acid-binding protein